MIPLDAAALAITNGDRWLLAFAIATLGVLAAATAMRRAARGAARRRGTRRRAGVLLVVGPVIGFAASPSLGGHAWVAVLGAVGLAVAGAQGDRRPDGDRLVAVAIGAAALVAVVAGVSLGPTGVAAFDVLGAAVVIAAVTAAANGLGNTDGLGAGVGAAGALGVFGLAGFAGQGALAAVAAGLGGACVAFLAFNLPPASLFIGTSGRLVLGYVLAVGALSARLPVGPTARLVVPLLLLGVLLLDAVLVAADRLARRRALLERRRDHLVHRLVAQGWRPGEAALILVVAQLVLTVLAVFTGRGVLALWAGSAAAALLVVSVGGAARRAGLGNRAAPGWSRRARVVAGTLGVALLVAVVPSAVTAAGVRHFMEDGRRAASRALAAARDGDDAAAELGFRQAAGAFRQAADKLDTPLLDPGLAVPGLAPNLRAARALADLGVDLADAGTEITAAVDPDRLEVVDGRLPLEEVRRLTPSIGRAARVLDSALARLRALDAPYLLSIVRDSLHEITAQLTQAAGEARRAAAAARLAPAIFGGNEPRTYLLVVQNNAELRATGGLIGNWGLMTAVDGKVSVGDLLEPAAWNTAVQGDPEAARRAPADFDALYPFRPQFAMQDANLSPNFPTAARVLTSLAPSVGLPPLDGVLAVDPVGLAALLELTGPVRVSGWPTDITAANVVDVALRDQYSMFEDQGERSGFLGDVARAVVDQATSESLGAPAQIAKVLGAASHEGHLTLSFTRPDEQRLARQLDVAGDLRPVRSDALGVYTQNGAANKIDYYLKRRVLYRIEVEPSLDAHMARVHAQVTLELENTAPSTGLPRIVIGPFDERYTAGVNRSLVSVYTPLAVRHITVDGAEVPLQGGPEAGRETYSLAVDIPSQSTRTVELRLEGRIRLRRGGWYELDLGHQPTIEPDRVQISVRAAPGWEVASARGLTHPLPERASGILMLERPQTLRVRLVRQPAPLDLWARLEQGT